MLEGDGQAIPAIYGMDPMRDKNTFIGTKTGTLHQVPPGMENHIIWPEGTWTIQGVVSPSGHLMLPITRWNTDNKSRPASSTYTVMHREVQHSQQHRATAAAPLNPYQ